MEKFFHIACFITQGSSYISAYTYGIMHRLHHAHTDTGEDPHSPQNTANVFTLMWLTRNNYFDIYSGKTMVEEKYKKNLPEWKGFDKFAHNWLTRILWIGLYSGFYILFATAWWQFLLLPLTITIGSLQGAVVNCWAHCLGYVNYKVNNTSKNILPVDLVFWGEGYHNNHHFHPGNPNNANRWFEFDMGFLALKAMDWMKFIHLKPALGTGLG
jgi:stearoyl-CoA desaturase (delta-9 desaturase)